MMPAYLVVDTKITDEVLYEKYKQLAKPVVKLFGGEYLARGGTLYVDQNDLWSPERLVIIRFPNMSRAKEFLKSNEYKPIKACRFGASQATLVVVEGLIG